jgi:hypothetical protein
LALVDAKCPFNITDVGAYNKSSDGGLFTRSILGKSLEAGTLNIPSSQPLLDDEELLHHVIVSDEAFPMKRDLLQPYWGVSVRIDENKQIYNHSLSRAFCILTQKCRLFLSEFN